MDIDTCAHNIAKLERVIQALYDKPFAELDYTEIRGQEAVLHEAIVGMVQAWCDRKGVEAHVRLEGPDHLRTGFAPAVVCIYNNKGAIDGKQHWFNKIVIGHSYPNDNVYRYYVRSHKATTDAAYLAPLDVEFLAFIDELFTKAKEACDAMV